MNSELKWVACSKEVNETVAPNRHLIYKGSMTTLCGCTASHPEVWRGNTTKPECMQCVQEKERLDHIFRAAIVEKHIREN